MTCTRIHLSRRLDAQFKATWSLFTNRIRVSRAYEFQLHEYMIRGNATEAQHFDFNHSDGRAHIHLYNIAKGVLDGFHL
jgi:hypothetical protein